MGKLTKIIIILLIGFGLVYKLLLTSQGNFIFNMDNGRDMVDVREMVELKKPRLIGQTSGIAGLYTGPGWYYLLSIPYIFTQGDPYAEVFLMIILWVVGGLFLLRLTSRWGILETLTVGLLWTSSNYITLATLYAYNPNPVTLLMPIFIYLFDKYLKRPTTLLSISIWLLSGLFLNFEMAFGIFMPIIIILTLLITAKTNYLKTRDFPIGLGFFILTLLPQILFEIKHNFIMFNSVIKYLDEVSSEKGQLLTSKIGNVINTYFGVYKGTLMNWDILIITFAIILIIITFFLIKTKSFLKTQIFVICSAILIIPFLGYIFLPIKVMPWHLGGSMTALILLVGFLIFKVKTLNNFGRIAAWSFSLIIGVISLSNLQVEYSLFKDQTLHDPSIYSNEIAAVDYVYQKANKNMFRVYTYLPSVYDYPYQYLFWWYGRKKYGYLPSEYAYLPNKPQYIPSQKYFSSNLSTLNTNLVFLIKEQNRPDLLDLWENSFNKLSLVKVEKVGPLEIETRTVK